jgi:hypothetical protein
MPVIEFSFPDKDLGQAGQIAQELRRELSENGIPPESMSLVREDPESMSMGYGLAVDLPQFVSVVLAQLVPMVQATAPKVLEHGVVVAHIAAIAHTVYEVCIREHCAVHVKTPKGIVQIGPGEVEAGRLRAVLRDAFDVDPEP